MTTNLTKGSSAGSNAGRGISYQDLVGACLAARVLTGQADFLEIVPEGGDDFEIRTPAGVIIADARSIRPEARPHSPARALSDLSRLWQRPLRNGAQVSEYWLVHDRALQGAPQTAGEQQASALIGELPQNTQAAASFIEAISDPLREATLLIASHRNVTPFAAQLLVLTITQQLGQLASENGPKALEERRGLSRTDIENLFGHILQGVDSARLDQLQRSGFVEPVDFNTPLPEPAFYLGVDVQPGHFAAGLALLRDDKAANVTALLETRRIALLTGPSDAGKSSLMWRRANLISLTGKRSRRTPSPRSNSARWRAKSACSDASRRCAPR